MYVMKKLSKYDKIKTKMNKFQIFGVLIFLQILTGCHGGTVPKSTTTNDSVPERPDPECVYTRDGDETWYYARFYIIDSCEYVHIDECWVHKGNCKFCEKREDEKINRIIDSLRTK